ncbi:bifunctional metallophosphatase/5'-nucleotidase [Bacteroides propionicifaciens]|jgi:5'-nucleotidase|uniref:bifunctional metallophosphatase/5'-nucleotidase n=1 Tax=Bacteroides propionicifaciens TaxID=392838 RepID=UPI000368F58E|nr:metallophosphatase [Bacteroides propionicifaciens]
MRKYNLHIALVALFLLTNLFGSALAQQKELYIYHSNDTHSRIEPIDVNSADKFAGLGGYVRRATCIDSLRIVNPSMLLFDCGDFSQGTPYYNMYKGEVEVLLMNEMQYDAATIGNHEFDFGLENMARLFELAKFPIVCANYDFRGTVLEALVKPYIVIEREGLKIGVFGLSPRIEGLVQASNCEGVSYLSPADSANKIAKKLKEELNCDYVICLSHLGLSPSALNQDSDQVLVRSTSNIDLVLGGHSHTFMNDPEIVLNKEGKSVPISQMGKNGVYLGMFKVTFEPN